MFLGNKLPTPHKRIRNGQSEIGANETRGNSIFTLFVLLSSVVGNVWCVGRRWSRTDHQGSLKNTTITTPLRLWSHIHTLNNSHAPATLSVQLVFVHLQLQQWWECFYKNFSRISLQHLPPLHFTLLLEWGGKLGLAGLLNTATPTHNSLERLLG